MLHCVALHCLLHVAKIVAFELLQIYSQDFSENEEGQTGMVLLYDYSKGHFITKHNDGSISKTTFSTRLKFGTYY